MSAALSVVVVSCTHHGFWCRWAQLTWALQRQTSGGEVLQSAFCISLCCCIDGFGNILIELLPQFVLICWRLLDPMLLDYSAWRWCFGHLEILGSMGSVRAWAPPASHQVLVLCAVLYSPVPSISSGPDGFLGPARSCRPRHRCIYLPLSKVRSPRPSSLGPSCWGAHPPPTSVTDT